MLLARELLSRGHRNKIGFFLHTPCAPPDILETLPQHRGNSRRTGATMIWVGFQTENDRNNFADYLATLTGAQFGGGAVEIEGRKVRLSAFPVSIETKAYTRLARSAGRTPMLGPHPGKSRRQPGSCSGSIDWTIRRAFPTGIEAFERLLENYPEWRGKATLLQIAPKSRSEVKTYGDIEAEVTGLVGKVNGRFGDAAWTPIRYVNRSYSRSVLAGIYRAADVAMVTPLRDGIISSQRNTSRRRIPEDPGVLVLSQFAGAAKKSSIAP